MQKHRGNKDISRGALKNNKPFHFSSLFSAAQSLKLTKEVVQGRILTDDKTFTGEALPTKDYSVIKMVGASVPGFVLETWLAHVQTTLHEDFNENDVVGLPQNAILYAFHGDTLPVLLSRKFLNSLGAVWTGYHGLLSYLGSFGLSHKGFPCFRFNRKLQLPVIEQIEAALKTKTDKRFYLFTDSGQPYFRVRKSLLRMAKVTGRPLVPVRHFASCSRDFNGHQIPLPGTAIRTVLGAPIFVNELMSFSDEEAVAIMQQRIDALASSQKVGA